MCEDQGTSNSFKSSSSSCVYKKDLGPSCSFDEYKCQNGNCINKEYECDGLYDDCGDGSDEHYGCKICFYMEVEENNVGRSWELEGLDKDVVGRGGASLNAKGQSCSSGHGTKGCCFKNCGEFRLGYSHNYEGSTIKARLRYYDDSWGSDWITLDSSKRSTTRSSSEIDILIDFEGCFGDRDDKRSLEKRAETCDAFST